MDHENQVCTQAEDIHQTKLACSSIRNRQLWTILSVIISFVIAAVIVAAAFGSSNEKIHKNEENITKLELRFDAEFQKQLQPVNQRLDRLETKLDRILENQTNANSK